MKDAISPKQAARAIGASEASLKRWCDQGLLPATKTAGGHRRLPISGVVNFIRQRGMPLVEPEVLGMPATTGGGPGTLHRARQRIEQALIDGDGDRFRAAAFDLYLAGNSLAFISDRVISPTFAKLGEIWQHGSLEIFQERRAIEICTQWLFEIRQACEVVAPTSPYALGATLSGDPYTLPSMMIEVALRESGWNAESYGVNHPIETMLAAIRKKKPRLVWISFSAIRDPDQLIASWPEFYGEATRLNAMVAVGGRALTEEIRREMDYSVFCDTLHHLVTFLSSVRN
ncbi:MAG: cobalamin B12-binding domain-containing protein [Planctomycetota bacterium]